MDLTDSYERCFPAGVLARYELVETRDAASVLAASDPDCFSDVVTVLEGFALTYDMLTKAGGNKGRVAEHFDRQFRELGWREAQHRIETTAVLILRPHRGAGEVSPIERRTSTSSPGHLVDNVKNKVALDVEWNAKDGNLDRDLSNFRALYDVGILSAGVIVTRHHVRTKYAANYVWRAAGNTAKLDKKGKELPLLSTATTTNLEKLRPRLERGDAGGCPVLAIAVTDRCYVPAPGDPVLPEHDDAHVLAVATADLAQEGDDDEDLAP